MSRIGFLTLMAFCVSCFLMALILSPHKARAHDYWSNGHRVDPITKNLCCSGADTTELDPKTVRPDKTGFMLLDTGEFIPFERVQPSPDTAIWASRWGGSTKCFFYPSSF